MSRAVTFYNEKYHKTAFLTVFQVHFLLKYLRNFLLCSSFCKIGQLSDFVLILSCIEPDRKIHHILVKQSKALEAHLCVYLNEQNHKYSVDLFALRYF